jgi:hypothetical protein
MEGKSFKHPEVSSNKTRRYETDINLIPKTFISRTLNKVFSRRPNCYVMLVVQNIPFSSAACTSLARESCRPLGQDKEEILRLLPVDRITECRGNIHNSQFIYCDNLSSSLLS